FPFMEASTLLEIARHELRPMDLQKLDSKLRTKADDTEGGLKAFNTRASTNKDYPSLAALVWPLSLYFRILIQFAISGRKLDVVAALTDSLFKYMDHLFDLNGQYEWSAVLQYHMDYHALRCWEMVASNYEGWGDLDIKLMALHLV
ncbi:hypothetical protein L218DRAFT_811052, partial [Marasmius fiardii PR-910]